MSILEKFFGGKRGSIDNSNLGNLRTVPPSRMKVPPPPRAQSSSLKNCGNIGTNPACNFPPPFLPGMNNNIKFTITDIDNFVDGNSKPNYFKKYSALQNIDFIDSYLENQHPGTYKITISIEKLVLK